MSTPPPADQSTKVDQFTEYAVRVTYSRGNQRTREFNRYLTDAVNAYVHESSLHGEQCVEFLSREVTRTEWVAGKLPPKVAEPPDGVGDCEPQWPRQSASPKTGFTDVPTGGML